MRREFNNLQTPHECRGSRVENLMTEKRGILDIINDEKKESKRYNNAILVDAEKVYSGAFMLM